MQEPDSAVVLVADSDASVLKNVSSTLEKAGFRVLTAQGTAALLAFCERHPEPVQLAILDTAIPGSAPDVVERLYSSFPGIRILYTSNTDDSGNVRQIGRSGKVREFLRKPFRRSQLLGRVLQVLDTPLVRTA